MAVSLPATLSSPFDCHGPPRRLDLLAGSPMAIHIVDEHGLRTTEVDGVALIAFVQYRDGSQGSHGPLLLAARGLWQYTHDTSPLAVAVASGAREIVFFANLTRWLSERGLPSPSDGLGQSRGSADCCHLSVPDPNSTMDASLARLYVPPLEIVRLVARNTGVQGGYGLGDSIEVTFRTRTDRAGLAVGTPLDRSTVDSLLYLSHDLGPDERAYFGVWRDDCTLLLVVGNATGATPPPINRFTVRIRRRLRKLQQENEAEASSDDPAAPFPRQELLDSPSSIEEEQVAQALAYAHDRLRPSLIRQSKI